MTHYVYTLSDPRTPDRIRYVGVAKDVRKRYRAHIFQATTNTCGRNHKRSWIRSLLNENIKPLILVIDSADSADEIYKLEISYIAKFLENGHDLTNLTAGGEGTRMLAVSEEVRAALSVSQKKRLENPAARAAIAKGVKAFRASLSDSEKAALAQANSAAVSRYFSKPEARAKSRAKALERWSKPSERAKAVVTARKRRENQAFIECRRKLARAQWLRPSMRSRMESVWSDSEWKKRMSEAAKLRWANPEYRAVQHRARLAREQR